MKKRIISMVLAVVMLAGILPVIQTKAYAVTWIKDRNKVDGSDYTKSPALIEKLNSIFDGNASIYSNKGCTQLVNTRIGTSNVPDNKVTQHVGPYGGPAINSGTSCWIYGNGVYYTLFGECTANGTAGKNSVKLNLNSTSNKKGSYANFKTWGVRQGVGALIRADGHSMIVLSYDANQLTILDGNGDRNGLVSIRVRSWNEISFNVEYIIQPKEDYFNSLYPEAHVDTLYRCYGIAEVKSSKAYVKSMPCSRGTDPNSDDVEKPAVGDMYTVLSMVKNTEGKYWYEVARFQDSKPIGYMYAGDVTYYQDSDIVDSNVSVASEIQEGKPITISGTVSSDHQKIVNVYAFVTTKGTSNPVGDIASIDTDAVTFKLSNLSLGTRPIGDYTLHIGVKAKSNYSPDGNTLASVREQVCGYQIDFSVVEEAVCSHSYTSKVTAPTTTSQGYTTYTCTKCGHSYKGNYTNALNSPHKITFDPNGGALPGAYTTNTLNGINVERASGFLVIYNNSGKLVDTNKYGVEVLVDANNKVIGRRDYLSETKQTVPKDGFVLSGQGTNGSWVEKIATGHYVAYDESRMEVYVYDSREAFEAHHKQVPDGGEVGLLPTPTREGYTFDGWYTYREGGHKITEEDCMGSDLTFYAHWVKNSCTNGCSYYGQVKTAPTKNSDGALLCTCLECGDSLTVVLPAFNTTDYECDIITEPTCKQTGLAVYGWLNHDYGLYTFDVVIDALGDTGHEYAYAAIKKPTETTTGVLTGTCSGCSGTTTVTLPKLNTTEYTYKVTKEPSYTATGTGRYTWKTTTYGTFYFDVMLDKLTAALTKIEVAANPTKTVYEIGESLDTTGLTLKATYSDGSTKTITSGFTTSGFDSSTVGTKTVKVSYAGMSTNYTVTVNAAVEIPVGKITIESAEAKAGDMVSIAVYLDNNPGVAYAKLEVTYSDALTLVSAEDQAVLTGTFTTSQTIGEKPYVLQWMGAENSTKNGCIVILTFRVAEDAKDGAYDITMTCGEAYNAAFEDITFAITNASVAVTSHTPGDVNGDGKANGKDGILLAQYLAGWSAAVHMDAADVNGDGKVNGKDGILLAQYLAGWDVVLG